MVLFQCRAKELRQTAPEFSDPASSVPSNDSSLDMMGIWPKLKTMNNLIKNQNRFTYKKIKIF
jgi:hypothetical protein